jgi:hypothetical protein
MSEIKFYIPKDETIPTDLRLYAGDIYVCYKRIKSGFRFYISIDDEDKAIDVAKEITDKMKFEHDESQHGVSWRTISLEVVPQDERYRIDTIVDWIYRVRDSY